MLSHITAHKVLVVGGCGYFGHRLIRWLIHETKVPVSLIHVVDVVKPLADRQELQVQYHLSAITDRQSINQIIDQVEPGIVIHTATPPHFMGNLDAFMLNNVEGTRILLDVAIAQPSVKVFLYTSSSSVIHDTISDLVDADESYPLVFMPEQRQVYSHSKAVAEQLVLTYNRKREDFVVAAIRPSAMFGPNEHATINNTVERAKRGSLRYQVGDGTNLMDFTYVDNTVEGLVLAVNALLSVVRDGQNVPEDMRVEGEAFIITNDEPRQFWGFFREVGAAAGYPTDTGRIVSLPKSVGIAMASVLEWAVWAFSFGTAISPIRKADIIYSTIDRTFDISKAKKRLGYRPRISIDEGIRLAVAPLVRDKKAE